MNHGKAASICLVTAFLVVWAGYSGCVSAAGLPIKQKLSNGVRYTAGGVGKDERIVMTKMAKYFHLKLVFSKMNGDFIARVPFGIHQTSGETVLKTVADGPWVLVDLPPGNYRVTAAHQGIKRSQTVRVGSGLVIVMFHWRR